MIILDLFAGLGGERRRAMIEARGHQLVTLDVLPEFGCTITQDIMTLNEDDFGVFDFIWASPPCETWSVASIGTHWNKDDTPKTQSATDGIRLVKRTLELMQGHSKYAWVLENPRGKLRKMDFMQGIPRDTVTYCQYGDTRMKPTDIWHVGLNWKPRPMCKNGYPCHQRSPRGSKTGTQGIKSYAEKSIVPEQLWAEILECLERTVSLGE